MIKIKKDYLKALLNASSSDKMRDNIKSVHFDTVKKVAEATDGHMLFSFPIEVSENESSVILSSESLTRALKVYPKELEGFWIEKKDNQYKTLDLVLIPINDKYPDTSAVTPSFEKNGYFSVTLGSAVLEKLVKIAKESEKEFTKMPGITFSFCDDNSRPVIVETTSGQGVIMPMRDPVRDRKVA